jgi:dihydroorotate dehydrogenase
VYSLIRPLLFALDAERSHDLTLALLRAAYRVPGTRALVRRSYADRTPALPVEIMGLRFPNPVGLAAGLDKEARCLAPLLDFGFGFLELGTVTPQPRRGLIGINLGKNKLTPDAQAIDDYLAGLRAVYAHADYVTLNISSPNTPGLRALQDEAPLAALLAALKHEQGLLAHAHGRQRPCHPRQHRDHACLRPAAADARLQHGAGP